VVPDREHRQLQPDQPADVVAVRARGVDHRLAGDLAMVGLDRRHPPALQPDAGHPRARPEPHALSLGVVLVAGDEIGRLQVAVARAPQDRQRRAEIESWPQPRSSRRVHQLGL
jgi:hypothetical protein